MYTSHLDILQFGLQIMEVNEMAKRKNNNKGKKATSLTPQGYGDTEFAEEPKTKLEEAAKKKNTK